MPDVIGVPHAPPKRKRSHVVYFRTDDEEITALKASAVAVGLTVEAFCRLKILDGHALKLRSSPLAESRRLRARQITAVNRVGDLVNQAIHVLNEIALAAPAERDRLFYELGAARRTLGVAIPLLAKAMKAAASK